MLDLEIKRNLAKTESKRYRLLNHRYADGKQGEQKESLKETLFTLESLLKLMRNTLENTKTRIYRKPAKHGKRYLKFHGLRVLR